MSRLHRRRYRCQAGFAATASVERANPLGPVKGALSGLEWELLAERMERASRRRRRRGVLPCE